VTDAMEGASARLAEFASGLSLTSVPRPVVRRAKLSILDALGTALLSAGLERSRQTARAVRSVSSFSYSSSGRSTVWGLGFRTSPRTAALVNGMLVEALDYSDIHVGAGLHPASVVLPAVLSYGEAAGASGADLLVSHIAGCEAMVRIGLSAPGRFHARGVQPTSAIGTVGAALATSRAMGLDAGQTEQALSLATGLAFGSSLSVRVGAYFGGVDSGRAAESGVLAAALAREGVSGIARDSLEGRFGFLEAQVGSGGYDLDRITRGLGRAWEVRETFLKRYPTSYACTQLIDSAIRIGRRAGFRPSDVEAVTFGENAANIGLFSEPEAQKRRPSTIYEAKTSHYFLLALALSFGAVRPEMLQARLRDRAVLDLSERVRYVLDDHSHWVEVVLGDGSVLRETQDGLVATPDDAVRRKFRENAAGAIGDERAGRVESAVDSLEELGAVGELASLLRGTGASRR
jgi:2-methylcitrate dehydratase PrpD